MAEGVEKDVKEPFGALPLQKLLGLSLVLGVLYGGYHYAPDGALPVPRGGDLPSKMMYTFRCFLFPAVFLWVAISMVGLNRTKVGAINPLTGNEHLMESSKKRLLNTMEQTTFYVLHAMFLTTLLEREEMKFILLYTILFVVARVFFWVGYGIHPVYRALGIVATFGSVFVAQVLSVYLMCSRYLMLSPVVAALSSAAVPVTVFFLPVFSALLGM